MTRLAYRALLLAAGAIGLMLLFPAIASADNCSGLTDCFGSIASSAASATAIATMIGLGFWWMSPDRCEELREACRQAQEEAAAAQAEAERLRRRADELAAKQGPDRVKKIRDRLAELEAGEKSWMEGAAGRLQGVRLTSDDLHRLKAEEQKVRDRYARGEIGVEERERLLARWGDEDYVRENAAKWASERAEERKRLQEELKAAEAEAGPAQRELEEAQAAAKAAEDRAKAAQARADEACKAAKECEQSEAKAGPGAVNGKPDDAKDECDVAAIEKAIDKAKRDFENDEDELEKLVDWTLEDIEKFVTEFDGSWVQAMSALDDYFMTRREIADDLGKLHAALREMALALHLAGVADSDLRDLIVGALIAVTIMAELRAFMGALPEAEAATVGRAIRNVESKEAAEAGAVEQKAASAAPKAKKLPPKEPTDVGVDPKQLQKAKANKAKKLQQAYDDAIAADRGKGIGYHDPHAPTPQEIEKWNSLSGTKYDPMVSEVNVRGAVKQLDGVTEGTLKVGKPTPEAIDKLYEQYQAELQKMRIAAQKYPDFWDRMPPEVRSMLQQHFDNPIPKEYWLSQVTGGP